MEENRKKDFRWCLTWASYLFQLSSVSWRLSNIFPAHSSKFSFLVSIYYKLNVTNCSLAPSDAPSFPTLTLAHGTVIYLPKSSSHKTCLWSSHFIFLHSNTYLVPLTFLINIFSPLLFISTGTNSHLNFPLQA